MSGSRDDQCLDLWEFDAPKCGPKFVHNPVVRPCDLQGVKIRKGLQASDEKRDKSLVQSEMYGQVASQRHCYHGIRREEQKECYFTVAARHASPVRTSRTIRNFHTASDHSV